MSGNEFSVHKGR